MVLNIDGSDTAFHTQWSWNSSRAHAVFPVIFSLGDCIRGAAQWGTSPVWLSFDTDGAEWKQKVQPRCPSISPVVQPTSALPFHLPNIAFVRKSFTLRQKQKSILEQTGLKQQVLLLSTLIGSSKQRRKLRAKKVGITYGLTWQLVEQMLRF